MVIKETDYEFVFAIYEPVVHDTDVIQQPPSPKRQLLIRILCIAFASVLSANTLALFIGQ